MVPTGRTTEEPSSLVDEDKAERVKQFSAAVMPHAEAVVLERVVPVWAALRQQLITPSSDSSRRFMVEQVDRAVTNLPGAITAQLAAGGAVTIPASTMLRGTIAPLVSPSSSSRAAHDFFAAIDNQALITAVNDRIAN